MTPTVVVTAYDRPHALRRLLTHLNRAVYPAGNVRLVIAVDRGEGAAHRETVVVAESVDWPHGPKEVIVHSQHLGPVGNFLFALGLTQTYGDVIYFEDDHLPSPVFYPYATQALNFYRDDPDIAGICLSALWFNGYTHEPFLPLPDASDVFFLNVPFLLGQAYTREQWAAFEAWRASGNARPAPGDDLHPLFFRFPEDDWYPLLAKYAVATRRFTVYPRVSLCVGAGDAGVHFAAPTVFFQAPLQREQTVYRFRPLAESLAVYDSFFEILPDRLNRLTPALRDLDYAVDLYATKTPANLRAEFVLTSRPSRRALRTFGRTLWPHEMNVVEATPGREISLSRREDLRWGWWADAQARKRGHDYFSRRRRVSRRQRLLFALVEIFERWRTLMRAS